MGVPTPNPQAKVPVVQRPQYTLYLERATDQHSFVHCTITGLWTKEAKRQLLTDWSVLKELHAQPIYCLHDPEDHKHEKFISMFGLRFILEYVDALTGLKTHIYST